MFQYACGRNLAEMHGVELRLDVSAFETYTLHRYSLGAFNIRGQLADSDDLARYREPGRARRLVSRLTGRAVSGVRFRERQFSFDPTVLELGPDVLLDGYWQSERYFDRSAEVVREEFQLRMSPTGEDLKVARQIQSCESVSVHVRRGDYASNPATTSYHGLCTADYYRAATERIAQRRASPTFFVFSDEPDWARDNLRLPGETIVVGHNDAGRNFEDLRLMSLCQDNIVANSSFSWWGAWLNEHTDKCVVAPARWFQADTLDTTDLCPLTWVRL